MSTAQAIPNHAAAPRRGAPFGEWAWPEWTAIAVALLAFVAVFFRWFRLQHMHSMSAPADWGHAYFVPVISGYIVWQSRRELAKITPRAFWPGIVPLLTGIVCYVFFTIGGTKSGMLQGFSVVLSFFGLALLLLGPASMRYLFIPIAYLALGVTISERVMIEATFPLQQFASVGAWLVINVLGAPFGVSADVTSNLITIHTPDGRDINQDVAAACSGMRMVIAFLALGAATAMVGCRLWWQRAALVILAVPVAVVLNVARVGTLGFASIFDESLASGEAHTLIGTLLLIPGMGLFMAVVWTLNRLVREPGRAKP